MVCLGYLDSALDGDAAFDDERLVPPPATSATSTPTATSRSPAGSRTSSSARARTSRAKEVEDLLLRAPRPVADVAVIGLPDDERGERRCAVVVTRPGAGEHSRAGRRGRPPAGPGS